MDIDDAALMYKGWGEGLVYEQQLERKATMIICEVFNKTMGGKGVMRNATKMWELPGDKVVMDSLMSKHKKFMLEQMQKGLLKKHEELGLRNGVRKNGLKNGKF